MSSRLAALLAEAEGIREDEDPAQGLVRIETVRCNDFARMGVYYGWVGSTEGGVVSITECLSNGGYARDYPTHLAAEHIVAWRYADLHELDR